MKSKSIFHVFLDSPRGRENLVQTAFFAQETRARLLQVYLPSALKFSMYCDKTVITIELAPEYTRFSETAVEHVERVLGQFDIPYKFFKPTDFIGGVLPEIPDHWTVMACPRTICEKSGRIGFSHLGSKVRSILLHAPFPLLIPADLFKPWTRITVLYGGPGHGDTALKAAARIAEEAELPLSIFTQFGECEEAECVSAFAEAGLTQRLASDSSIWQRFTSGTLQENLYSIPQDSLVVIGTGKHSLAEEILFGTTLEQLQSLLPQPLLVYGTRCCEAFTHSLSRSL